MSIDGVFLFVITIFGAEYDLALWFLGLQVVKPLSSHFGSMEGSSPLVLRLLVSRSTIGVVLSELVVRLDLVLSHQGI